MVIFYDLTGIILAHLCKELKQALSWEFIKSKLFTIAYNVTGTYHLQCGLRVPKHTKSEHTHRHYVNAPRRLCALLFLCKTLLNFCLSIFTKYNFKVETIAWRWKFDFTIFFPNLEISPPLMQMSLQSDMFTNGHQAKYNKH